MAGRATLTIVTSSWMTKKPRQIAARATSPVRCGPVPAGPASVRARRAAVLAGTVITPGHLGDVGARPVGYPSIPTLRAGSDRPPAPAGVANATAAVTCRAAGAAQPGRPGRFGGGRRR